jgi:hypothetical protein
MNTCRKQMGRVLQIGLGAALLASSVFMSGSARAVPTALCSASDATSSTGRQYAKISISPRDPDKCIREKLGGEAPFGYPDCWKAAAQAGFNCVEVIDIN